MKAQVKDMPEYHVAYVRKMGPYGKDTCEQAWDDAFTWLVNSGYECGDKPCYELYHDNATDHPEGKWIFDICIPLKADK
jgi:DNA gyrase inhibitor GyrI